MERLSGEDGSRSNDRRLKLVLQMLSLLIEFTVSKLNSESRGAPVSNMVQQRNKKTEEEAKECFTVDTQQRGFEN
jgi:hypothetical protein